MKKIFILLLTSSFSFGVLAQTTTTTTTTSTQDSPVLKSKKGENYLPETGEWALGISANSLLGFLSANVVNSPQPVFNYAANPDSRFALFGKLMVDQNTAYRVRFNLSSGSNTDKAVGAKDIVGGGDPLNPEFITDERKVSNTEVVIGLGLEKRRGSTRLQGIYGAELVLGYRNGKTTYDYGNAFSADFTTPTSTQFDVSDPNVIGASRVTEFKSGSNFLVGARGFIGVEYFLVPKISIGGEFGYMLAFQTQKNATQTTESWDGVALSTRKIERDINNDGFSSLGLGLDNLGGSINLVFYF